MNGWIRQFHYKELFLAGFYLSFIIITSIACIIDWLVDNPVHASLDALFVGIGTLFFARFLKTRNRTAAARAIFWTATVLVFIFVVHSGFDMSVMFTLLLPIVAFILMPPREIFLNMSLFYLILIALLFYGYNHYGVHPILHSAKTMSAYLIASLFVIAFGIFYNVAIEQSHKALERANREKEILLQEIHHRIKNNLQIMLSIIRLQRDREEDERLRSAFLELENRIGSIAKTHELLYRQEMDETVEMGEYIRRLCRDISASLNDRQIAFHIDTVVRMGLREAVYIGLIVNELVSNAIKYAGSGATISILLERGNDDRMHLHLGDNGGGYDESDIPEQSLGLTLVTALVTEQLGGELHKTLEGGTSYDIRFDYA